MKTSNIIGKFEGFFFLLFSINNHIFPPERV